MKKNAVENASEALGDESNFVGDSKNFFCYFSMFLYILYILYIYFTNFSSMFFFNTLDGKVELSLLTFPITVLNFVEVLKELSSQHSLTPYRAVWTDLLIPSCILTIKICAFYFQL